MEKESALKVVQIDENALDKECVRLPTQYLQAAHNAAEAKCDVGELENALKLLEAELTKKVRANPGDYGLEKVTESALSDVVRTSPSYVKQLRALSDCKHDQELAQALVWALEAKKRALTLLVELHGMSWFSRVKPSQEGKEAIDEKARREVRTRGQRDRDDS